MCELRFRDHHDATTLSESNCSYKETKRFENKYEHYQIWRNIHIVIKYLYTGVIIKCRESFFLGYMSF